MHARLDPWKTLGVSQDATEKEIKRAHRRLVLQHHPDRVSKDRAVAEAKFIDIQEAYEILIGRRRGKEIDANGGAMNKNGWDWHDWYWTFSLRWRRRRSGGRAQEYGHPPAYEMRERWKHQLFGLKAKAARKARKRRPAAPAAAYSTAKPTSQTVHTSHKAAEADNIDNVSANYENQHKEDPGINRASQNKEANPSSTVHHQAPSLNNILVSLLVDAMSNAKGRHDAALKLHSQRIYSQIIKLGNHVARRVRIVKLDESWRHESQAARNVSLELDQETPNLRLRYSRVIEAREIESEPLYIKCDNNDKDRKVALCDEHPETNKNSYKRDKHAEKFANRKAVESRLQNQLAGLKRRAVVKQNVAE